MSEGCIFCRIVKGELPSTKVYEDAEILAFMDIGPIIKGHTLVIPKAHVESFTQAPIGVLSRVMGVAQMVAQAQKKGLQADGANVFVADGTAAGQVVPHLHVHVVPRFKRDGHNWNWAAKKYENMDEMRKLSETIQSAF